MLDWPAVVSRHRRPSIVWSGLGLLTLMLVPAAIALACNPQAQLALDKSTYYPGDTMTISGSSSLPTMRSR